MAKISDAEFQGRTSTYSFEVYPLSTTFNAVGAVYVYSRRTVNEAGRGTHKLLYIGQTNSLSDRLPDHEKLYRVLAKGANCICVHADGDAGSRLRKETDLRSVNATPCNDQ